MWRFVRRGLRAVLLLVLVLAAVLAIRTAGLESRQIAVEPAEPLDDAFDLGAAVGRLTAALRYATTAPADPGAFLGLHAHIEESYPRIHRTLLREVVNRYSLLYVWPGSDPSLAPIVLMAHLDVVPVEPGTEERWESPPYAGEVVGDWIVGRGVMDDKCRVMGQLEAVEYLLARGFAPRRTVYLAFGHDEETGGAQGGARMATLLEKRGVEALFVLDEGMTIVSNAIPGSDRPVAFVGLAEKGCLNLELSVQGYGGHSSTPPAHTAVGTLAAAVARLENEPMPAALSAPVRQTFAHLAPELTYWSNRMTMANLWLFEGSVLDALTADPVTNALIRTTVAPTTFESGLASNQLAHDARAVVNFRLRPGDTLAGVTEHVERTVADRRVRIERAPGAFSEPSNVSSTESEGWRIVATTVRQVFSDALVAPGLLPALTDARYYAAVSADTYRFSPLRMRKSDRRRVHGTNERLKVENYREIVAFYVQLIRNAAS